MRSKIAFTIIEMLVVIVVLGILAMTIIPQVIDDTNLSTKVHQTTRIKKPYLPMEAVIEDFDIHRMMTD